MKEPIHGSDRFFPEVGAFLRRVREARGVQAQDLAARAGMRPSMVSHLQKGGNAAWGYYDAAAAALGFRSALELFTSGGDEPTANLLRLWRALTPLEQMHVLHVVRAMLDASVAPTATATLPTSAGKTRGARKTTTRRRPGG
jgi:hypothetical protein